MLKTYRVIRKNWRKNHSRHGGFKAVARCLRGTLALRAGLGRPTESSDLEVLTFSVVPWMTALWTRLLKGAIEDHKPKILIGDCSGGIGEPHLALFGEAGVEVHACLNEHHGDKIDLFLARLCRAPYVLVVDDDIFWLDDSPLRWAMAEMDRDPDVAVASLRPRGAASSVMRHDGIQRPMGSHCLLIRRELWVRERLSFAVAPPPPGAETWFYDTADFANRELLRRGYRVALATPEVESHFVAFDGVSAWILKIQGHSPAGVEAAVADMPVRQEKAWQAILICRGLAALLSELRPRAKTPEIVAEADLDAAESVIEAHMDPADRAENAEIVEQKLEQIRRSLTGS